MIETPYCLLKRLTAEFLSETLALEVHSEHIICPSRQGDLSSAICRAHGVDAENAVLAINAALNASPLRLYGKAVFKNAVHSSGYLNFTLANDFVFTAAREMLCELPLPDEIDSIKTDADYALAKAAELYERSELSVSTADDDTAYAHALWLAFGLLEKRMPPEYSENAIRAVIAVVTAFPVCVPSGLDLKEYCGWLMKILAANRTRSN